MLRWWFYNGKVNVKVMFYKGKCGDFIKVKVKVKVVVL